MYKLRGVYVVSFAILVLLLIPVFALIVGTSLFPLVGLTTFSFWGFITSPNTFTLVQNTLVFALCSAAITTVIATTYSWFIARTDLPWKRFFELIPILGLTLPPLFKALAWTFLFNANNGLANQALRLLAGPWAPVLSVSSMPGLILVEAVNNVPIVYLVTIAAMKSLDASLEEGSRVAGRGIFSTFLRVTFPVVRPAVFSAFVLAVIGGINNFDYTFIIGVPAGLHFLATEVYYYTNERVIPAYGSAGYVSVLYVIITFVAVGVYIWSTRRAFKFQVVTGKPAGSNLQRLGSWRWGAAFFCLLVIFFEFFLPLGTLILISTTNVFIAGLAGMQVVFPTYFVNALQITGLAQSIQVTLTFAVIAGLLATGAGAVLSFAALRSRSRGARLTEYVSAIPLAFPGVVYGVSLFWTFLIIPGFNLIYGTIWPLVFSLVFLRLPFSTRIISGNLVQIAPELEDASQVAGARFRRTFSRISIPLIKEGILNGFIYTFVASLRELGGVILLVTSQTVTFTALILSYWSAPKVQFGTVAAATVLFSLFIAAVLVVATIIRRFVEPIGRSSPRPRRGEAGTATEAGSPRGEETVRSEASPPSVPAPVAGRPRAEDTPG